MISLAIPPPFAVRNSFTNQFFQLFFFFLTSLYRDIHTGDSWPYVLFMENCQKSICMLCYSPIHVDRSLRVSNRGDKYVPYFKKKNDLSTWIGEQPCMQMDFWQFSRNNMYVSIPGKLSEMHLHAWLFSNPCGKVLIIVGISLIPDLRVQHTIIFIYF